jgi:hypothetical protein
LLYILAQGTDFNLSGIGGALAKISEYSAEVHMFFRHSTNIDI